MRDGSPPSLGVVVALGPNPAALTELVWQLALEGRPPGQVVVVTQSEHARDYLKAEVLGPGGAWAQLRAQHPEVPPEAKLQHVQATVDKRGEAFAESLFQAFLEAQAANEAVLLALSGGRWRGNTAYCTTVFQLLARPEDLLVDVRLSLPAAEGGTGFFFPTQPRQHLLGGKRGVKPFRARDVEVLLAEVKVPRLRPLLGASLRGSYAQALAHSAEALVRSAPPQVRLDLHHGRLEVNGQELPLSRRYFPYVAWVVEAARRGQGVHPADLLAFRAFLQAWQEAAPTQDHFLQNRTASSMAGKLLDRDHESLAMADDDLLKSQVGSARRHLGARVQAANIPRGELLHPELKHEHHGGDADGKGAVKRVIHRLPLPAAYISLCGPIQGLLEAPPPRD